MPRKSRTATAVPLLPEEKIGRWFWIGFFLLLWMVLLRSLNPSLMNDDSGEIVTAARNLGVAPPPGYPILILMGRLATLLPLGTVAFRMNLLSAFFLLTALFFLSKACRAASRRLIDPVHDRRRRSSAYWMGEVLLAAILLSLFFCESVFARGLSAHGGVHTLALLNLAVLLAATLKGPETIRPTWILFFWSVGLGAHWPTQLLWLVLLATRFRRTGVRWSAKRVAVAGTFVVLGLSSYLALPLRAQGFPVPNWGHPVTTGSFFHVVLRRDFLGAETILHDSSAYGRTLVEYGRILVLHWWPGFFLLSLAGLAWLFRRHRAWALWLAAGYAAPVLLITQAGSSLGPDSLHHFGAVLASTQAFPALLGYLGALVGARFLLRRGSKTALTAAFVLVLVAGAWGARVFHRQDKSRYTLATDHVLNLFQELPRDAMVLTDDDLFDSPGTYLRSVLGLRKDVAWVPLTKLQTAWGLKQVAEENGPRVLKPGVLSGIPGSIRYLTDSSQVRSSAVFYTRTLAFPETFALTDFTNRLRPWGLSEKLENGFPSAQEIFGDVWALADRRRLRNLASALNLPETEYSATRFSRDYARPHVTASALALRSGILYEAARHSQAALAVAPRAGNIHLNLANYYMNNQYHELARTYCLREFEVTHDSPAVYMMYGNIMMHLGQWEAAVAAFTRCLELRPDSPEALNNRNASNRLKSFPPPPEIVSLKQPADYDALGRKYEEDGQAFLAGFAYETAREIRKNPIQSH